MKARLKFMQYFDSFNALLYSLSIIDEEMPKHNSSNILKKCQNIIQIIQIMEQNIDQMILNVNSTILASLLATRFANKWPRLVPFILQMSMEYTCHSVVSLPAINAINYGNLNIIPSHKSGFGMNSLLFTGIGDDYIRLCNILRAKCSKQIITQPASIRFSNPGFGLLNFTCNQSSVILEQSLIDFRNTIYFEQSEGIHISQNPSK